MKARLPGQNIPIILPSGQIEPIWYAFFKVLSEQGILDLADVDNSTPITNGQVLVFDGTAKKFKPGAN